MIRLGLMVAVVALALDQFSKFWLLEIVDIDSRPPMAIGPIFNLVMVWNRGISFGMLAEHNLPYALVALSLVIVAVLATWLRCAQERWVAFSIGLVIGGALGNVVDRLRFGAVADFFDFHVAGYHWPAFNIADASIFIGVVLLCAHSMLTKSHS